MAIKSEINKKDLINLQEISNEEFSRITDNLYSQLINYKLLPNLVLLPNVNSVLREKLGITGKLYITKNRLLHTNPVRKNAHKEQGFFKDEYKSIPDIIRNATYALKESESSYNSFLLTFLDKNNAEKVNCIIFDEDKNGNLLTTIKKIPLLSLRNRIYEIVGAGVEPAISNALREPSTSLTTSPNDSNLITKEDFVNTHDNEINQRNVALINKAQKLTRSEYLKNKTELTDEDIVQILDLPHEKPSNRELPVFTDKAFLELKEYPEELNKLASRLKLEPEYLKYRSTYIAKSKLLFQESRVLYNEIPALMILDEINEPAFLLPYLYSRKGKDEKSFADSILENNNAFTDFKRVFSEDFSRDFKKGKSQGSEVFIFLNHKKYDKHVLFRELKGKIKVSTAPDKTYKAYFYTEQEKELFAYSIDKTGFVKELNLKQVKKSGLTPLGKPSVAEAISNKIGTTSTKTSINLDYRFVNNSFFNSLLERGAITEFSRNSNIKNRNERYLISLINLESVTNRLSDGVLKSSNLSFIQKEKNSQYYKDLIRQKELNHAQDTTKTKGEEKTMEKEKIEVQTYKFQNGETIDEILSKETSWDTDEGCLDNMIDSSLREVADFADEKEYELLKRISIVKNNPEVDLKLLAVQTDAAARYMAAKHYDDRLADTGKSPFSKDFINPYAQDDFPYELPSWMKNHLEEYPNQNVPEHTSEEEKAYQEIVSGTTGSGKTTMINEILQKMEKSEAEIERMQANGGMSEAAMEHDKNRFINYVQDEQIVQQAGKNNTSLFIPDEKEYRSYQKQLDDYLVGNLKPSDFISLGKTPPVLEKIGVNQNEVVIFQNVIDKALRQPQTDENGRFMQGHEIDVSVLEKLPEYISNPLMVFKSDTVPNSKVIMTEYQDVNDRTVIVALHCDSRADSGKLVVNRISSVYRKDNDYFFLNQIKKGNLEYIDEKRSREWAVRQRLQLPPLTDILGYSPNLTTKEDFVNSQNSMTAEKRNVVLETTLTPEELKSSLKSALNEIAKPLEIVPFTRENYNALFPESRIQTPIEEVKLGEHQFEKLDEKERQHILKAVHEALNRPDIIINEERKTVFGDIKSAHLYEKSFVIDGKNKAVQSVVVAIEDENVSISTHQRDINNVVNKIKMPEQLIYLSAEVGQVIERTTGIQLRTVNPTRVNENIVPPKANIPQNTEKSINPAKSQERHSDAKDYLIQTTRLFLSKLKEKNLPFLRGKERGPNIIIRPQAARDAATGKAFTGYTQLMAQALIQALYDQKKLPELEYDLITYDQAKACGTFIKKGSPHITLTNYNRTTNSASKQMYYFKSGCNSPEMIDLHKESIARNRAIKRIRQSLENKEIPSERQTEEKNKITLLHYEEMTYLKALNKDTEQYFDSLTAEEKEMLKTLCSKEPLTQKTVKELAETLRKDRLISAQLSSQKNSGRSFDATECIVPEDFIGKAMAAASLGCSLETTQGTIDRITKDLHQTLSRNIEHYDYGKPFETGEIINGKCRNNVKDMCNKEYEAEELAKKIEQQQMALKKNPINALMELLNRNDLSDRTIGGYER